MWRHCNDVILTGWRVPLVPPKTSEIRLSWQVDVPKPHDVKYAPTNGQDPTVRTANRKCEWLINAWWRHDVETFSASLTLCKGNHPPATDGFPSQKVSSAERWCFVYLRLNKRLNKQGSCQWFQTLWNTRHVTLMAQIKDRGPWQCRQPSQILSVF